MPRDIPRWSLIKRDTYQAIFRDQHGHWQADIHSGCLHLWQATNRAFDADSPEPGASDEDDDYMHICDLDEFIDTLLALRLRIVKELGEGEVPRY